MMKRLMMLLILSSAAFGQGVSFQAPAIESQVPQPIAGLTGSVCLATSTGTPCTPTVTVYSDPDLQPAHAISTLTTNGDGLFPTFFISPGQYQWCASDTLGRISAYCTKFTAPASSGSSPSFVNLTVTGTSTLGGGGSFAGVWNKKNSADTYILQLEDSDAAKIRVLGFNVEQQLQRTGTASDLSFGNVTELWTPLTDSATYTGQETALYGSYSHFGSGALTAAAGVEGEAFNPGPATAGLLIGAEGTANCGGVAAGVPNQQTPTNNGNCTNIRAVEGATHNFSSGTATNAVAFFADTPTNTGGGTITNAYGLLVSDQNVGTNKWAIKTGAGKVEFGDVGLFDSTLQANTTMGVGTAPVSGVGLLVNNSSLSGLFQFGVQVATVCTSASTSLCEGVRTRFDTAAAGFTVATGSALHITEGTKGAGSAITTENGLLIDTLSNGGTNFAIQTGANPSNFGGIVMTASNSVALTADWTCGTAGTVSSCTAATIVGSGGGVPLTFTLPSVAAAWTWECDGVVGQATAATSNQWNILTATNGATNVTAYYDMYTAATAKAGGAVTDQASTTTTFQIAPSWTLGGTATKMPFHIWGRIEGASASGTVVSLQLLAPTVGDLVTIYRGASCRVW